MFGKSVYSVKDTKNDTYYTASSSLFKANFPSKRIRFSYSWWPQHWHFILGGFLKSHLTLQDNDFESLLFQVNTLPETNVAPETKIFVEDGRRLLAFFQFHLFRCYINGNVPILTSPLPDFFSDLAKNGEGRSQLSDLRCFESLHLEFLMIHFCIVLQLFVALPLGSVAFSAVSGRLWSLWCLWYYKMDNWYTYHKYCT